MHKPWGQPEARALRFDPKNLTLYKDVNTGKCMGQANVCLLLHFMQKHKQDRQNEKHQIDSCHSPRAHVQLGTLQSYTASRCRVTACLIRNRSACVHLLSCPPSPWSTSQLSANKQSLLVTMNEYIAFWWNCHVGLVHAPSASPPWHNVHLNTWIANKEALAVCRGNVDRIFKDVILIWFNCWLSEAWRERERGRGGGIRQPEDKTENHPRSVSGEGGRINNSGRS